MGHALLALATIMQQLKLEPEYLICMYTVPKIKTYTWKTTCMPYSSLALPAAFSSLGLVIFLSETQALAMYMLKSGPLCRHAAYMYMMSPECLM